MAGVIILIVLAVVTIRAVSSGTGGCGGSQQKETRTSSPIQDLPAVPDISGRSYGLKNVFQNVSVVPYPLKMFGVRISRNRSQAAFSSGAPMVTSPFRDEISMGSRSCVLASISRDDGEPVRNVILYFST